MSSIASQPRLLTCRASASHDLRHTHATKLLSSGVHPKVAQERRGHSSVGITLDLYSRVLPGMQEDAAAKVDAAIRAAIDAS
jgi:integrase